MKTVFKEGMTVYDSLNFPNKKGFIKSINMDNYKGKYPIIVEFKEEYKNDSIQSYTLEGVYKLDSIPTLSTKPYEIELKGFEQKPPIPTYEEILLERGVYVSITKPLILPDEVLAKAFEALAKLVWIRDYYNNGWKPDFKNNDWKYAIEKYKDTIENGRLCFSNRILVFKTEEIRDKFLKEQRELLEIAKPLL